MNYLEMLTAFSAMLIALTSKVLDLLQMFTGEEPSKGVKYLVSFLSTALLIPAYRAVGLVWGFLDSILPGDQPAPPAIPTDAPAWFWLVFGLVVFTAVAGGFYDFSKKVLTRLNS